MIPRSDFEIGTTIPSDATFWMPTRTELSEEGIGMFRDTWLIDGVSWEFALEVVNSEQTAIAVLDSVANDELTFDRLSRVLELGDIEGEILTPAEKELFNRVRGDTPDFSPFDGLEIGVAGLALSLSALGVYPAASCRGHATPNAWSSQPVVLAAIDRATADAIQPELVKCNCSFELDPARPQLISIVANSVTDTVALASCIIRNFRTN